MIEVNLKIGTPLNTLLKKDDWMISRQMFILEITGLSNVLHKTILPLLLSSEKYSCIGVSQAQASLDEPGKKQVSTLILKILAPNSGTDIVITKMLSSMNSVVTSTSHICSDGSIVTQLLLNAKDPQLFYQQKKSGSQATWIPDYGFRTPTNQQLMR